MRCKIPANDLMARLDSSFCLYDDLPVYVRVDGRMLRLYDPANAKTYIRDIMPEDPLFDISTPPLGYCQYERHRAVHVTRLPLRKYKQGFDSAVARTYYIENPTSTYRDLSLISQPVKLMMSREYPTLLQCIKSLKLSRKDLDALGSHDNVSQAVSNECALVMNVASEITVYHMQSKVGTLRLEAKKKPVVVVPHERNGWIISLYLSQFDWIVE